MAKTILAFGGGLDSTGLLAIHLNRDLACTYLGITRAQLDAHLPQIDAVVFSDPGAEFQATYENVEANLQEAPLVEGATKGRVKPMDQRRTLEIHCLVLRDRRRTLQGTYSVQTSYVTPDGKHLVTLPSFWTHDPIAQLLDAIVIICPKRSEEWILTRISRNNGVSPSAWSTARNRPTRWTFCVWLSW